MFVIYSYWWWNEINVFVLEHFSGNSSVKQFKISLFIILFSFYLIQGTKELARCRKLLALWVEVTRDGITTGEEAAYFSGRIGPWCLE